ncbi:MAG: hypothetical protein NT075_24105 [Chloroflexi bacterium]|nr:hypothetical protein [Chloroflexota bacterium]
MSSHQVTFPNQQMIALPAKTITAIEQSKAKYTTPLWQFRSEKVLKLGEHQWIYPSDIATARAIFAAYPMGLIGTAWKLFNRGWLAAAEAYFVDTETYPNHPRYLGINVIPLVDEDNNSQQIGWVRINQATRMDANFAVFVQFTLLDLFEPRPLPAEYA